MTETGPEAAGEVEAAVGRARAAFAGWAALGPAGRRPFLRALTRAVARNPDRVAEVVGRETGKPAADAVMAEALHAAVLADYYARRAGRILAPRRAASWPLPAKQAWVQYRPYGVAAAITPWNYPFLLPFLAATTALAAGCTVVVKPSELAPASGALVAELAAEAGLPPGAVQVVHGGPAVGEALVRAGVDVVAVTGSAATGRRVAALAAERLTPVIAELGGKDPMVVLEDADLRRAARAAVWGACFGAGQSCVAVERVYVAAAVHDRFLAALEDALGGVRADGGGRRDIGPLVQPQRVELLEAQVADALAKGARLHRGGRRAGPRRFPPTLLSGVDHTMAVMREETLGPLLPVMAVADEAEAVRLANDSPYGLAASVWTADPDRGRRVAGRLRAGAVAINDCLVNYAVPDLPFGGVGTSGAGRQAGPEGLRAYCFTQSVTRGRLDPPRELQWFPRLAGRRAWSWLLRLGYGR